MSTSLLYQAFGVRGYRYRRTDVVEGRVCFTLEKPRRPTKGTGTFSFIASCAFNESFSFCQPSN